MEFVVDEVELRIDPEFRDKIPPLTKEEFEQLRENILDAGEVYEPISVWNGVIVDGHNRWKIIQENPHIKYRIREMDFVDKWAAYDWMYKNQLGRRNLTEAQRTYMIGRMYEARKKSLGASDGFRGNQHAEVVNRQNGDLPTGKTSVAIAKELGVGQKTVERAEKFAHGVDALQEVSPEAANKVLNGEARVKKQDIIALAESEPEQIDFIADAIVNDVPISKPKKQTMPNGNSTEMRELYRMIDEAYAPMIDADREVVHTIEDLVAEIEINGESYVRVLKSTLACYADIIKGEEKKQMVSMAISHIIQEIVKTRGEYVK